LIRAARGAPRPLDPRSHDRPAPTGRPKPVVRRLSAPYIAGPTVDDAVRVVRALIRYEFQMLLGVHSVRARKLVASRHRVRIYVPFGTQWYEYSLRRRGCRRIRRSPATSPPTRSGGFSTAL